MVQSHCFASRKQITYYTYFTFKQLQILHSHWTPELEIKLVLFNLHIDEQPNKLVEPQLFLHEYLFNTTLAREALGTTLTHEQSHTKNFNHLSLIQCIICHTESGED